MFSKLYFVVYNFLKRWLLDPQNNTRVSIKHMRMMIYSVVLSQRHVLLAATQQSIGCMSSCSYKSIDVQLYLYNMYIFINDRNRTSILKRGCLKFVHVNNTVNQKFLMCNYACTEYGLADTSLQDASGESTSRFQIPSKPKIIC